MKKTVIERLRHAERWFASNGPQWQWVRELVFDAQQELESQSGSLWCQWSFGTRGHARIFIEGEMNAREIESLIGVLRLNLSWAKRDEEPPSPDAVDPHVGDTRE